MDDYDSVCKLQITKHNDNAYTLEYLDENNYTLYGTKTDTLQEIAEHLDNMKGDN